MRVVPTTTVDLSVLARVGTALSDDSRRRILVRLLDGPAFPADLAAELGLTRPGVSNHLACLQGCGIVVKGREGRNVRYAISDPRLAHALGELCQVMLGPAVGCEHEGGFGCE
ncbi:MAG: metalloregulator ArsR/SmtB family transcription factor [Aquihabitans sp.]